MFMNRLTDRMSDASWTDPALQVVRSLVKKKKRKNYKLRCDLHGLFIAISLPSFSLKRANSLFLVLMVHPPSDCVVGYSYLC